MNKLFFLLFLIYCVNSFAQVTPISMNCTIKGVYEVDSNGRLKKVSRSKDSTVESILEIVGIGKSKGVYADAEGSEFVVNRKTGVYTSRYLKNDDWKKEILDYGSKEQSFKVLSTSIAGYMHSQYLQIDIYVETYTKPFYLTDGTSIFSGVCN